MLSYFTRQATPTPQTYVVSYVMGVRMSTEDVKVEEVEALNVWDARDKIHRKHAFCWIVSCNLKEKVPCDGSRSSPVLLDLPDALTTKS